MTLEERFNEIKSESANNITDYESMMEQCYYWGLFVGNFINNFDFSGISERDLKYFVNELGEGYSFKLEPEFISNILKANDNENLVDSIKKLIAICNYNCFGFYQRFNTRTTFVNDSVENFVRGFKESNNDYTNVIINCSNRYTPSPFEHVIYPNDGIEILLYKKWFLD